jgi:DNA-binding MarR family transcriptional regulator
VAVKTFHQFVEFLRKELKQDMPLSYVSLFLLVCLEEGITMPEIGERLDMSQASVSRGVKVLGRYREAGETQGFNIIFTTQDLEERRRFAVFLTPEGKKLRERIIKQEF